MIAEPELTDAGGLAAIVLENVTAGIPVFSFEDPARFPLPPEVLSHVRLEFPNAERLWRAWELTDPDTRDLRTQATPQPIYLKPPHITPAKRPWLVQP